MTGKLGHVGRRLAPLAAALAVAGALAAAPRAAEAQVLLHIQGAFHPGLPMDPTGHAFVDYSMTVTRPGVVTIDLVSGNTSAYDPYLRLFIGGRQIAYNDDGGGALNARISQFLQPGVYTVRVSKFGTGPVRMPTPFTLRATLAGGPPIGGVTPLSDHLARSLASTFYHSYGEWAGQYAMHPSQVRIVPTGPTTMQAHIRYTYNCVRRRCRGARSGHDQRVFYFQWNGSQWQCINMGPHMSARF